MRPGTNIPGLVIWNDLTDDYDHNQLAGNWDLVDDHDHTLGNGKRIPRDGIASGAIGPNQLAPDTVTSVHIVDKAIQRVDLADGIIGMDQIDPTIFNGITPLGVTTAWFRPNVSVPIPTGWAVADGSSLNSAQHGWGNFNVTLPDLQNKFVLGASTTGTGSGPTTPPAEWRNDATTNSTGGAHSRFFDHSHTVPGHSHTVNSHTHDIPFHTHPISGDGDHHHSIHSRMNAFLGNISIRDEMGNQRINNLQSLYVAGFNGAPTDPLDAALPASGSHSHGGSTGGKGGTTTDASPGTDAPELTTRNQNPGGDIRPAYVGLLYIVKVKHGT